MGYGITDTSLMMIFLLEECDLACPHCIRGDEPMDRGYRLTFRQLRSCLEDCRRLPALSWVHFSGGEPTLWREGDRDLVDLLVAISNAGFTPGFTSNGRAFPDPAATERFLGRYFEATTRPLKLYLSIDTFHRNFDPEAGRARCLDSLLEFRRSLADEAADRLEVRVLTALSTDPGSRLPDGMVAHYESLGVAFIFVPLRPAGRARNLGDICPEPPPAGGPDAAGHLILIGDEYHLHLESGGPFRDRWRRVGRLGAIPAELAEQYASGHAG